MMSEPDGSVFWLLLRALRHRADHGDCEATAWLSALCDKRPLPISDVAALRARVTLHEAQIRVSSRLADELLRRGSSVAPIDDGCSSTESFSPVDPFAPR